MDIDPEEIPAFPRARKVEIAVKPCPDYAWDYPPEASREPTSIESAPWWRWLQLLLMIAGVMVLLTLLWIGELLRGGNSQRKAARSGQTTGLDLSKKEDPPSQNSSPGRGIVDAIGKMKW